MNRLPTYLLITEILLYSCVLLAGLGYFKQAIGRLRYVLEHWETFFYQYFIVKKYDL